MPAGAPSRQRRAPVSWAEAAHHPRKDSGLSIFDAIGLNIGPYLEQLLPAQPCLLCGQMSHDGLWCQPCDAALPYLTASHCQVCAVPTPGGRTCGRCLRKPPHYSHTTAVFAYAYPLDRLIQEMKFHERLVLAEAFAAKLAQQMDRSALPDRLIAMPLHPARLRERGFNQSLLLARALSRKLKIELLPNACRRLRDTHPQASLPWAARKKNMRNAFVCDADLNGLHVALIDDVLTTGASLDALAGATRRRGATEVSAWVIARTLPRG